MIVKGTTKSGIKFQLDSKIKDDTRLVYLLTQGKNAKDQMDASEAVMKLIKLIFGSDENTMAFMDEVANKHKGVCDVKSMMSELMEMLNAIEAKNS